MAAGAEANDNASLNIRHNLPELLPVMVLALLAVDLRAQGLQQGAALLQDPETQHAVAQHSGVRALLVHAMNDKARAFYEHYSVRTSPVNSMNLIMRWPQVT